MQPLLYCWLVFAKIVAIHPLRGPITRISIIFIFALQFAFTYWFGIVLFFATEALAVTQYLSGIIFLNFLVDPKGLTIHRKFFLNSYNFKIILSSPMYIHG